MRNPTYDMKAGELIAGARTLWVPIIPLIGQAYEPLAMNGESYAWRLGFYGHVTVRECPYRVGQTLALCEGWRIGWYTDDLWTVDYQDGTTSEPIERCDFQKPRLEPVDDSLDDEWRPASTMPAWAVRHHFGPLTTISVKRLSEATIQDGIDAGSDGEAHPRMWIQSHLTALHGTAEWFWVLGRDA